MSIKSDLRSRATRKYMVKILEMLLPRQMSSIRKLLQIAVQCDLLIHHMDVKSPYLNAPLDHEIYVDQPKGVEGRNGNYAWKPRKSL